MSKSVIIQEPLEPRERGARATHRTWAEAYKAFLMNGQESFGLKILPLVAMGLLPAAMADDILLPFLGMVDNVPMAVFVAFIVVRTWSRVKNYR